MRFLTLLATVAVVHAFYIRCRQVRDSDRVVVFELSGGPIMYFKSETKLEKVPHEVERILTFYPDGMQHGIKLVGETDYYTVNATIGEAFEFPSPGIWCGAATREYIPGMYYHGRKKTRWLHELNDMIEFVRGGNCNAMLNNGTARAEDYDDRCIDAYNVFSDAQGRLINDSPDNDDPFSEWDMDECRREFRALKREGAVKLAFHKTLSLEKFDEALQIAIRQHEALNLKDNYVSRLRKADLSAQCKMVEDAIKKELREHMPALRGAMYSLATIMLVMWGLYYKSTSLVAQNLLSCVIIPNTIFVLAEIFWEHTAIIINVIDFEVTVGRVEWMRQFSNGYGITHPVKQKGMLSGVTRVFRVLTYTSAIVACICLRLLPYAIEFTNSVEIVLFVLILMTKFILAMRLILPLYEFTVWYYLWRGINLLCPIGNAYWHLNLTIVLVVIGVLPKNICTEFQGKIKEVPLSSFELADLLFKCALPFLLFYQWWAKYELEDHEPPLPEVWMKSQC